MPGEAKGHTKKYIHLPPLDPVRFPGLSNSEPRALQPKMVWQLLKTQTLKRSSLRALILETIPSCRNRSQSYMLRQRVCGT